MSLAIEKSQQTTLRGASLTGDEVICTFITLINEIATHSARNDEEGLSFCSPLLHLAQNSALSYQEKNEG